MRAFALHNGSPFSFSSSRGVLRPHAERRPQRIFAGKTGFVAGLGPVLLVSLKATAGKPKAPKEEFHDAEVRILGEYLQDLTIAELETVAQKAEIKVNRRGGKRGMVLRLLEPTHLETVRRVVAPEEVDAQRISSELLEQVEDVLDSVALTRPWGAGQRARLQEARQGARKERVAEPPLQICDVRTPLHSKAKRKPLEKLKVGGKTSGQVVQISLLDGIRVDIGAEVDALVPVPSMEEYADEIAQQHPLGSSVQLQIEDLSNERFPVLCSLTRSQLPKWDTTPSGTDVELEALDDWEPEGEVEVDPVLQEVPERPPPEVVMSMGPETLEAIQVLERPGTPAEPSQKLRNAWEDFLQGEVESLRWQLRSQQQLAKQLAAVEAQLLRGKVPDVPVDLLGMTLLPDGQSCMLPVPDGDCLKFRVKEFDAPKDLQDWICGCRERHKEEWSLERSQVEGEGPAAKGMLTKFFSCADAWNARAVEAAEEEEIRKLQLQEGLGDAETEPLEDVVARMTKSGELKMQDEMEEEYLGRE